MGYFVVHPGGQQYGPADIATLNQWAAEGRLVPDTTLIDAASGAQMFAHDVAGLFFPLNPGQGTTTVMPGPTVGTPFSGHQAPQPFQPPYQSPYPRQSPLAGPGGVGMPPAVTASYVASGIGLVLGCCAPFVGVIAGIIAVALGFSANSIDPGRARGAIWLGIGTTVISVLLAAGFLMLGRMVGGGGGG